LLFVVIQSPSDKQQESLRSIHSLYVEPFDVLFKRGGPSPANGRSGNQYYFAVVKARYKEYHATRSHEKKSILIEEVVRLVQDEGGRFFQQDGEHWKEVPPPKPYARRLGINSLAQSRKSGRRLSRRAPKAIFLCPSRAWQWQH
jgi:hypothetical protein